MKLSAKDRQACKEWYIRSKTRQLMSIAGEPGITIKTALLSGLRVDELAYVYNQPMCEQDSCNCKKIHMTTKSNGLTIVQVNWIRKQKKCYLAILPSRLWQNFRAIVPFGERDLKNAEAVAKRIAGIDFADIRRLYCSVIRRTMDTNETQVMIGKATMEVASYCITQVEVMTEKYCKAWEKVGIILPVL